MTKEYSFFASAYDSTLSHVLRLALIRISMASIRFHHTGGRAIYWGPWAKATLHSTPTLVVIYYASMSAKCCWHYNKITLLQNAGLHSVIVCC